MKINYLFLLLFLLLTSCVKDNIDDDSTSQNESIANFLKVKIMDMDAVFKAVPIARTYYRAENETTNYRSAASDDFEIIGDIVTWVSDGVAEYYTFQIYRKESNLIENLIVVAPIDTEEKEDQLQVYMATYDISPDDSNPLKEKESTSWTEKVSIFPIQLDDAAALIGKREEAKCYEVREVTEKSRATGWDDTVLNLVEVRCPGPPGGVAGHDSHQGNNGSDNNPFSGGGSSGGAAPPSGIYTVPNMYGYEKELKNFKSGVLDAALRKYYKSDSNIKNAVNNFLKQNSFSVLSQNEVKAALSFAKNLQLNFEQFHWAFINSQSQNMRSIEDYLTTVILDEQTKGFVRAAIAAWMKGGEVAFQNEIIKDPSFMGTKADCVLTSLITTNNNLFKKTSEAFTGNRSKFKIKFTTYSKTTDAADARTPLPDENGIIEIRFNMANVSNSNAIDLARIIFHETIHAELHRIKLTNNAGPNSLPQDQYEWYIKMWEYYENIFEGNQNNIATASEHNYMAFHQINNIARGLQEFDQNTHPLENYKYFAWTGLEYYGKQNKYITEAELSALAHLTTIVNTNNHINPCD